MKGGQCLSQCCRPHNQCSKPAQFYFGKNRANSVLRNQRLSAILITRLDLRLAIADVPCRPIHIGISRKFTTKGFQMKLKVLSGSIALLTSAALFAAESSPKDDVTNAAKKLGEKA